MCHSSGHILKLVGLDNVKTILRENGLKIGTLCLVGLTVASFASRPKIIDDATGPLLSGAQTPPAVLAVIDRACRDCHSEATRYPWYSYVAPISFLIQKDVAGGRRHLNLSRWRELPLLRRTRALSEIANQVQNREMPLSIYTLMHSEARLSEADIESLFEWTQAERARLISGSEPARVGAK
jgi:hypothetical protein